MLKEYLNTTTNYTFRKQYHPPIFNRVGIRGIGSYLPDRKLSNYELEEMVDTSHEWIISKTGIKERRIIGENENVLHMAKQASIRAINSAGVKPNEIDLVVAASISFEYKVPTLGNMLTGELGLKNAAAFDVNAGGCPGFLYSLITGAKFIDGKQIRKVLCVSSEAHSKFINWKDRSTCVIFGDGAGATVLDILPDGVGILGFDIGCSLSEALLLPTAQIPGKDETYLKMDGRKIWEFATAAIPKTVSSASKKAGINISDIDMIICHQANINIIECALKTLGISMDKTHITIDKYGNTGGPSVCITFDEAHRNGKVKDGDIVAFVGFIANIIGAGLFAIGDSISKKSEENK